MSATVASLLAESALARADAEVLLRHALGVERAWLVVHANDPLTETQIDAAHALFARRAIGEPIAYIVGEREFYSLALTITPDVLIPRPETELLVDLALERLRAQEKSRVLDLATGSGAVAIAIAKHAPRAEVWASDWSPAALAVAQENARRHETRVRFVASDWFTALGDERFDVIVSNPPYVAAADRHLLEGDLRFEPRDALVGGSDGLECIRRIVAKARRHLHPQGWLLFEHGHDQAAAARALLREACYDAVASWKDLAGIERVSGGREPDRNSQTET